VVGYEKTEAIGNIGVAVSIQILFFALFSNAFASEDRCVDLLDHLLTERVAKVRISGKLVNISYQSKELQEAYEVARKLNIDVTDDFLKYSTDEQLYYLNQVLQQMAKIPPIVHAVITTANFKMELVRDSVVNHPEFAYLRGRTPRGWPAGSVWDEVPGCASKPLSPTKKTVIAANRLREGHGSVNLVLHEHAHSFDIALTYLVKSGESLKFKHPRLFSRNDKAFIAVWKMTEWNDLYLERYPEEGFAESFAYYFHSPNSRAVLRQKYPLIYHYFVNRFGKYSTWASR